MVSGDASVFGNARVFGNASVFGNARVFGNALVSGDASVSGNALVSGDASVFGNARLFGDARVAIRIICATRSDGYTFVVAPDLSGAIRIIAGCRYFTIDEAREHWRRTRGGTPLGEESLAIVDHLERMSKVVDFGPAPVEP